MFGSQQKRSSGEHWLTAFSIFHCMTPFHDSVPFSFRSVPSVRFCVCREWDWGQRCPLSGQCSARELHAPGVETGQCAPRWSFSSLLVERIVRNAKSQWLKNLSGFLYWLYDPSFVMVIFVSPWHLAGGKFKHVFFVFCLCFSVSAKFALFLRGFFCYFLIFFQAILDFCCFFF